MEFSKKYAVSFLQDGTGVGKEDYALFCFWNWIQGTPPLFVI
jgi:hypothetical protein